MVKSCIPVAANGVIGFVLCDIDQFWIIGVFFDNFHRAVFRIIIHHNYIVRNFCFLIKGRNDGIFDGFHAVFTRNYHRCLEFKTVVGKFDTFKFRFQVSADIFQMLGTGLLHFNLNSPVFRIHVVKNLFTAFPVVIFHFVVQIFVYMYQLAFL